MAASNLALLGVGGAAAASGGFNAAVLALSPALFWPMDEASGTTATDASTNARNGTYGTGCTLNQTSLETSGGGASVAFNNTSNAKVTSSYNPFTGNLSIGYWCNPTDFTGQLNVLGSSNGTNGPALIMTNPAGQPLWFSDLAAGSVAWTAGDIPAASNSFVVLTWNNTTKTSELFVNAVSKGTKVSANAFNATPGNWQFGSIGLNAGFKGKLQAAFLVSSVLTSTQISNLYAAA